MNRKHRIAQYIAMIFGGVLVVIGIAHDIVNLPALSRALGRGEIAAKWYPQLVANVAFAGMTLSILGLLLLLVAPGLKKGKLIAWRVALVIGVFFVFSGVAGYLWLPVASVLIFPAFGALVCVPLIVWHKEFSAD
jgi:hypothetical protein